MKYVAFSIIMITAISLHAPKRTRGREIPIQNIDTSYQEFLDAINDYKTLTATTQSLDFKLDPKYETACHQIAEKARLCDPDIFYGPDIINKPQEVRSVTEEILLFCINQQQPDLMQLMIQTNVINPHKRSILLQDLDDAGNPTVWRLLTPRLALEEFDYDPAIVDQATIVQLQQILSR